MGTAIGERKPGAGDEVYYRARHEHFTRSCQILHPAPDVNGDARHVVSGQLDLARVHAGPHVEPELAHAVDDRARATHGPGRSVEGREETISGRVDLPSTLSFKLLSNDPLVIF